MALASALCHTLLAATGFTNNNLRVLIAGLLGSTSTPGQMTYDLRRLRPGRLIRRLPHTNRHILTADGIRIAVFHTKTYNRLLVPLTAANQPQAPPEPRAALAAITRHADNYARLRPPAPPSLKTRHKRSEARDQRSLADRGSLGHPMDRAACWINA